MKIKDMLFIHRQPHRKPNGFTLMEIMVAMAIVMLLATVGMMAYMNFLEHARASVCKTNLKGLHRAVQEYSIENDALPAVLGKIELRHLKKGFQLAMQDGGWQAKLAHRFLKFNTPAEAYAAFLTYESLINFGVGEIMFRCPSHRGGGASYGFNQNLENMQWEDIDNFQVLISDCDTHTFSEHSQLSKRHRHGKQHVALGITKAGNIWEPIWPQMTSCWMMI
jgi:prepilin-type N-terminal cleavage/methylation domain-containing protein